MFVYIYCNNLPFQEEFLDITELDGDFHVVIWTIVDGQLIAKSTVSTNAQRMERSLASKFIESENDR